MSKKSFYEEGLAFECTRCGGCCAGRPGVVFMSKEELYALAEHEGLTPEQFIQVYCRWMERDDGTKLLSLRETSRYECIFWERGKGCTVYNLRPVQCRTYPFWSRVMQDKDTWNAEQENCPGINRGAVHSAHEIEQSLNEYHARNLVTDGTEL